MTDLFLLVIYHDVMRLDIAVHDSFGMAEIECFEKFENVETDIKVGEFGIEGFEFGVLAVSLYVRLWAKGESGLTLTYSDTIDGVLDWYQLHSQAQE